MGIVLKMVRPYSFIFLLMLCLCNGQEAEKKVCLSGWVQATWVDLGCLLFNTTTLVDWEEAATACQAVENGRLVEIQTEEQMEFVQMQLDVIDNHEANSNWWTGGTDLGREGNWIWIGSLTPVPDFVFYTGQPNGGKTYNCLYLAASVGYEGSDWTCDYKRNSYPIYPICQQVIE